MLEGKIDRPPRRSSPQVEADPHCARTRAERTCVLEHTERSYSPPDSASPRPCVRIRDARPGLDSTAGGCVCVSGADPALYAGALPYPSAPQLLDDVLFVEGSPSPPGLGSAPQTRPTYTQLPQELQALVVKLAYAQDLQHER